MLFILKLKWSQMWPAGPIRLLLSPSDMPFSCSECFLTFMYKMLPAQLVPSPPPFFNQPFLQGPLAPFSGEWHLEAIEYIHLKSNTYCRDTHLYLYFASLSIHLPIHRQQENHEFTLIPPIPIHGHRVDFTFFPFHICTTFLSCPTWVRTLPRC